MITPTNIPAELRALKQWVCWRLEPAVPKPKKMPYTITGGHASSTNPETWATFAECVAAVGPRQYTGVGFVFTAADPYVGLDFDGMTWAEVAPLVTDLLPAYVEVSQSGKGIHVIVRGTLPDGPRRKGNIECYQNARYFALTGDVPAGVEPVTTIPDRTAQLAAWHAQHLGAFREPGTGASPTSAGTISGEDQQVLDTILTTRDATALHTLFHYGEPDDRKRSEARFKLVCMLCRATGDNEQVKRLLWASALRNPKWDTHRTLLDIDIRNARLANPGPPGMADTKPLAVTVADLAADKSLLDVPKPLSPWLVWRGDLTMLCGREKLAGKSTLFGSDAAGAAAHGLRVLWISAEEGPNRVVKRFYDLQAKLGNILVLRRWPQSWEEVEAVIRHQQPDAIYVDSLGSFLMAVDGEVPQANETDAWLAKMLRIKSWAWLVPEHSAGISVLKHATKADGTYAGSVGIGAGPDTIITMRAVDNQPNARRLELVGRWGFPSKVVRFVDDNTGYVDAPELADKPELVDNGPRLSPMRQKILLALRSGMRYKEWEMAAGVNPNTFKTGVAALEKDGWVRQAADGTWSTDQLMLEELLRAA